MLRKLNARSVRIVAIGLCLSMVLVSAAVAASDFGSSRDARLASKSHELFGVDHPVEASSTASISSAQAQNNPKALVTLANGLKARVVTNGAAAPNLDQIALWPNDEHPSHLIVANEQGTGEPGLQRIALQTGAVETIVSGIASGDPVRRTQWGSILFGEEGGGGPSGGRMYELLDPLHTTNVVLDRVSGTFSGGVGAQNVVPRPALGRLSFEGLAVYANGVVYYGDENRPASGAPGGAYFKFIPTVVRNLASQAPITNLDQSPLAAGSIYGLRVGRRSGGTDYGQGSQTGFGSWVPIPPAADADLRAQAASLKLTGYYRPEDIDVDRVAAASSKVRFCGANTGNEADDQNWGEIVCITDGSLDAAAVNAAVPEVQYLVLGNPELAMPDNVAYQPGRGNWIFHEDADTEYLRPHNNDLWDCLPDGADVDLQSDGCVRIATLNDLTAEWTGGIFDASGKRFFVSIQHNISGKGTILEITGWD